jgi:hypothetical protein
MNCRICKGVISAPFSSAELFSKRIDYFECGLCGYVQTEEPSWMDQAYASPINSCDTGIMVRNQQNVGIVLATLRTIRIKQGCVVDCAGGYGVLVRLLRDYGVDALWTDPYCKNLFAIGFEHAAEKSDLVTAFEAFEHFIDPPSEMEKMLSIAPNVLISTKIIPSPTPAFKEWWYYGLDHGQHIGFFRVETFEYLAKKFGKFLVTDGSNYHLFTELPVSSIIWRIKIKLAQRWPILFTKGLKSKTWNDFEKLSVT